MSDMSNTYDEWLTKQQCAQLLGVAEKTIDRLAARGELQKATRQRPGMSPVTVFHPGDISREKAKREQSPAPFVMPPTVDVGPTSDTSKSLSVRQVSDVSEVLSEVFATRSISWPVPAYLTEQQACRYSGLGLEYLRRAVTWQRIGPRGARVCRRADIDRL